MSRGALAAALMLAGCSGAAGQGNGPRTGEQRLYARATSFATERRMLRIVKRPPEPLARCLASNPSGRMRLILLSRPVRDAGGRYDRVLLHPVTHLLVRIQAARGGSRVAVFTRPGRTLQSRERATLAACL